MGTWVIRNISAAPELINDAADWFHEKWGIPAAIYRESMQASLIEERAVPQWYVVVANKKIIAGLGVIENDFHERKDLTPNICAVFVEKDYRGLSIAGELLDFTCKDMKKKGIDILYLITDHTTFYEKYHWEFLCLVKEQGGAGLTRMYYHKE
ncbi:GNAT family N-acetyltransferase [Enterococcus sp. LJL128]